MDQERFRRIKDPTSAEEEYVITKADVSKAGEWKQKCRRCRAKKEGDHCQTTLAQSAECRARVAEILADDVGFQTKMRKAQERKEGGRRPLEPFPDVQGGSSFIRECSC